MTTLEWIKIDEAGLISGSNPGVWASDNIISNNLAYDITIPSTLKAGNYVLRHEIIALHSAEQSDGAQNYPMCVNLAVTGSGSELPDGTLGTALYTATDAGILFNIYEDFTSYTIPGPALAFSDSSSSSSSDTAASAAASTTVAATTAAATTTAEATQSAVAVAAASATASAVASAEPAASAVSSCKKRRHARALKN